MKRISLIAMMVLLAVAGAWAQGSLETFQANFNDFADALAPTLSYNATVGNNWSDAYIGKLPHFGVGLAVGATTVPFAELKPLFDAMTIAVPAELAEFGLPIPAAALSAKLGGFILPFDLGVKAMILPDSLKAMIAENGITADYTLFGGNIRYGIIKENLLLPDVSIGAGYNRLSGSIGMTLDTGTPPEFTYTDESLVQHTIVATTPELALDWTTDSYDFTVQVSKNLLFIRPYIGAGYSFGKSTVSGGLTSTLTDNGTEISAANLDAINAALAAAGQPTISANGITFSSESAEPAIRVYGGVSIALIIIHLDLSATYVPATESLGASAMIRVQL